MIHPLIILLLLVLFIHDIERGPIISTGLSHEAVALFALVPVVLNILITHLAIRRQERRLAATGKMRDLERADWILFMSRLVAALWHVAAVIALGWLETVRFAIGDLILVDEAVATLPPLLVFVAGWWSFYPIERRLREAATLRNLETAGGAIYQIPTRAQYVIDRIRHQALLALAPISLILAWSEALERFAPRLAARFEWMSDPNNADLFLAGAQLAGVAVIFLLTPPIIRRLWDTAPLASGPLRDGLLDLCRRHGVRIRRMLVWRTHGMMINGAVMGVIGPLRYILLTDALLDSLPREQIEAVMAHEVGHVRRRHLPWLIICLISTLGLSAMALLLPLQYALSALDVAASPRIDSAMQMIVAALSVGAGLAVFGFVSRRFERQADAFAAQHMSGLTSRNRGKNLFITEAAAESMAGALQSVADLNHIPRHRFTWRHGSIASRQQAVRALIGRPVAALPIDRAASRIKLFALAAFALVIAASIIDATIGLGPRPSAAPIASHR